MQISKTQKGSQVVSLFCAFRILVQKCIAQLFSSYSLVLSFLWLQYRCKICLYNVDEINYRSWSSRETAANCQQHSAEKKFVQRAVVQRQVGDRRRRFRRLLAVLSRACSCKEVVCMTNEWSA